MTDLSAAALHRYIYDKPAMEYIKAATKNKDVEKPPWLNQKNLAEKLYMNQKLIDYIKDIAGVQHRPPSPGKDRRKTNSRSMSPSKAETSIMQKNSKPTEPSLPKSKNKRPASKAAKATNTKS